MKLKRYFLLFVLCLIGATSLSAQTTDSYTEVDVEKYYDEESCLYYKLTTYLKEREDVGAYYAAGKYAEVVDYYKDDHERSDAEVEIPKTIKYKGDTYTVNKIGDYAFKTSRVYKVSMPNTIDSIGEGAFYYSRVAVIDMGNAVKSIKSFAFINCQNLRAITLPASLSFLAMGAFRNSGLKFIKVEYSKCYNLDFNILNDSRVFYEMPYMNECIVWTNTVENAAVYRKLGFKNVICGNTTDEDVNHDGQVNSLDVLKVYKYMQTH